MVADEPNWFFNLSGQWVQERWGCSGGGYKELALQFAYALALMGYQGKIVGIPEWKIIETEEGHKHLTWMCSAWRRVGQ